ncbi:MAG TPA: prolyl oligopeptidase family serine peptidase [Thermoanaerobaculia bacterium]|nr:prolyl oligopeptidase family serine peptidase [Thermoanaerobaculia bacterium]
MRSPAPFLTLLLALAASWPAVAGSGEWTVDDLLLQETVQEVEIAPDGNSAVWVKRKMDKEKGTVVSNLFLTSLEDGRELALTRGTDRHGSPRFSPDGRRLAFVSDRPRRGEKEDDKLAKSQLFLLDLGGGEPWSVTSLARPLGAFAWQDDGHLVFVAPEDPTRLELATEKAKDTSIVVEDPVTPPTRLFRLALATGEITRLTDNRDWIDLLAVSPDGHWAVTRRQQSLSFEYDNRLAPSAWLTNLATGESRQLFAGTRLFPSRVAWQPDSLGFYFSAERSSHPVYLQATISEVHHFDVASGRQQKVDLGWARGLGDVGSLAATPDGFLALLADGVHHLPARFVRVGSTHRRTALEGEHVDHVFDWVISRNGQRILYEHSTASQPPVWMRARLEGARLRAPEPTIRLNPGWADKPHFESEVVRFRGARGDEVEGILRYPFDWRQGERRPLILAIHGGPAGADLDQWSYRVSKPSPLWLARGAFVLEVNYHGSSNYGLEWVESITGGKYYELEIPDLEAGVDALIARGLVDPERLATTGWSNGGILSAELITRTRRYKVASIGAADVEWISDWGNVDFGAAFDQLYFGASPLENPQRYVDKSPFFRLPEVTTPTIVFTGTEDRNVPPSQSWSLYRALQQTTSTPVRLVVFPGEPHGLGRYVHQRRKIEEELAWLDRYLFATSPPQPAALAASSPLGRALERNHFAASGGRLGRLVAGLLVPEVVARGGLALGRFEVTRAQYAAFDSSYPVPAGKENHPAAGITFEQARAYCEWLSAETGEPYRLPREAEVAPLRKEAGTLGNTLDHWAGFAPNPEEAEALRRAAEALGADGPLLAEVGRFDAVGEAEPLFDLGGNAAEWVTAADGSALLLGPSADSPARPKGPSEAAPPYRGFRVARE